MDPTFDPAAIQASRERLHRLLQDTSTEPYASKEHLQQVVQELSIGLEELIVAEEELRVQADDLTASAVTIDAERERYGDLFEFAPDAYLVTDEHGKILEANGAASRLFGVPSQFMDGKLLSLFVEDSDRREFRRMLTELTSVAEPIDERYIRMRTRGNDSFTAAVRAAGHRGPGPAAGSVRWMVRDITPRLRMEAEIRFRQAEADLLNSLTEVARLTAEPRSIEDVLQGVVERTAAALPGCEVTMALAAGSRPPVSVSSGARARALDEAEQRQGDGPGHLAVHGEKVVEVGFLDAKERWEVFAEVAGQHALHGVTSFPLSTAGGHHGALTVYAFAPISPESRRLLPVLVDQLVVALTNFELYESAQNLAVHLERALEHRGIIEQAKGVLIASQRCTDEQAFDILRRASQRLNRKLRDVACDVVAHVREGEHRPAAGSPAPRRERVAEVLLEST